MIDRAASIGTPHPVTWQQADALDIPFEDGSFDAVACQFGAMFFPDRQKAFAEMHRVLRPGGSIVFNVGTASVQRVRLHRPSALVGKFPDDPPVFLAPHGYHDTDPIRADVVAAGFDSADHRHRVGPKPAASCSDPQSLLPRHAASQRDPLPRSRRARGSDRDCQEFDRRTLRRDEHRRGHARPRGDSAQGVRLVQ
jgi:SAM-dependent methyltransferase